MRFVLPYVPRGAKVFALRAVIVAAMVLAMTVPAGRRREGSPNEASAIGALRAINSAQSTYASSCGRRGYASSLHDLLKVPKGGTVAFISEDFAVSRAATIGYVISLTRDVSAAVVAEPNLTCNGTEAVSSYFASSVPTRAGATGSSRSFATDARGSIFVRDDGAPIQPGMDGARPLQ